MKFITRFIGYFFLLIMTGSFSFAAEQPDQIESTSMYKGYNQMWIDLGFGPGRMEGEPTLATSLSASYYGSNGLYTLQLLYQSPYDFTSTKPLVYTSEPHPQEIISAEIYYGRVAKKKYGYAALGAGLSVMKLRYDTIQSGINSTWHIGLPMMGSFFITPLPDIGVGIKGNYLVSDLLPIYNVHLCIEIGLLR